MVFDHWIPTQMQQAFDRRRNLLLKPGIFPASLAGSQMAGKQLSLPGIERCLPNVKICLCLSMGK